MKKALTLLASLLAFAAIGRAAEWGTDFEKAKTEATERKVPILADFTGSDWCGWCIRLKSEVFSKEAFQKFAKENFVLFQADFPRRSPQEESLQRQNRALMSRFGVTGFPTILLLEADGRVIAKTGYRPGGADAYVEHLKELLAARKAAPAPTEGRGATPVRARD